MYKQFSVVIICAVLLLASNLFAQQQLATVKITVSDPSGAVLPGANITLTSIETGAQRTAVTEDNGTAVLAGVPAGAYNLTATAKQFTPRLVPVMLSVGQTASVNVTLGLSTREESVNVVDTAEGIDVEKADVSQVIDTRFTDYAVSRLGPYHPPAP